MNGLRIRMAILDAYYKDGSKTATVEQIAEEMGVHPCIAFAALEILRKFNILKIRTGQGGLSYYSYYVPAQFKICDNSKRVREKEQWPEL